MQMNRRNWPPNVCVVVIRCTNRMYAKCQANESNLNHHTVSNLIYYTINIWFILINNNNNNNCVDGNVSMYDVLRELYWLLIECQQCDKKEEEENSVSFLLINRSSDEVRSIAIEMCNVFACLYRLQVQTLVVYKSVTVYNSTIIRLTHMLYACAKNVLNTQKVGRRIRTMTKQKQKQKLWKIRRNKQKRISNNESDTIIQLLYNNISE